MAWWTVFVAPLIGGPVMWFLHRFDARNTQQHTENKELLSEIKDAVHAVDTRLDEHISWHLGAPPSKRKDVA